MVPHDQRNYRPDIDGLRAIAVLAVVLFHLKVAGFDGGYVGVDVFFVISGFLITQKLVREHDRDGTISFKKFYAGRIRRLFPALCTTTLVSLIAACIIMPPEALQSFAQSAVAAVASVSNIFFWLQAGYWDNSAHTKPLLHTWSLSVEEQFYLVWPLLILLLARLNSKKLLFGMLAGIGLLSFVAAEFMVRDSPSAVFYLTHFRVFEFALGALCVAFDKFAWPETAASRILRDFAGLAGLTAIIAATLLYDETTLFPGTSALLPCVGTAAIILSRRPPLTGVLLGNPVMVFVGLISYSVYLVHWPLIVFYEMRTGMTLDPVEQGILFAATIVGGFLLYRLVETPLRRPRKGEKDREMVPLSASAIWLSAVTSAFALSVAALVVMNYNGFPGRFPDTFARITSMSKDVSQTLRRADIIDVCGAEETPPCGTVEADGTNIIVLGSSLGADGLTISRRMFPEANFVFAARGGCSPVPVDGMDRDCREFNDRVQAFIDEQGALDVVVISTHVTEDVLGGLIDYAERLAERGFKVILLGPGPFYEESLYDIAMRHGTADGLEAYGNEFVRREIFSINEDIKKADNGEDIFVIDKLAFFCPDEVCRIRLDEEAKLSFFDHVHMTYDSAVAFGEYARREYRDVRREIMK